MIYFATSMQRATVLSSETQGSALIIGQETPNMTTFEHRTSGTPYTDVSKDETPSRQGEKTMTLNLDRPGGP
jgi:hypothetical protein